MRNLLLSAALVPAPVALFAAGFIVLAPAASVASAPAQGASLGDMTPFAAIVTDVQGLATKGDMAGAKARITDFETAWDGAEPTLRPTNKGAWGNVDDAADVALSAVRAGTPGPAEVNASLDQLQLALANHRPATRRRNTGAERDGRRHDRRGRPRAALRGDADGGAGRARNPPPAGLRLAVLWPPPRASHARIAQRPA